ncbi:MAG: hypothetical protein QI197_04615, partial [Candidatus Korarchaeota archaeon]|nr:hypothetical protein [Candidatus Korarchaeota archaeon]
MRALLIGVGNRPAAIVNEILKRGESPFSEYPREVTLRFEEVGTGRSVEDLKVELTSPSGRRGLRVEDGRFLIGEEEYEVVLDSEDYKLADENVKIRPGRYDSGEVTLSVIKKGEVMRRKLGLIKVLSYVLPLLVFFLPTLAYFVFHMEDVRRKAVLFVASYFMMPLLPLIGYLAKFKTPMERDEPLHIGFLKSLGFSLLMLVLSFLSFAVIRGHEIGNFELLSLGRMYFSETDPLLFIPFFSPLVDPLLRGLLKLLGWYVELPEGIREEWKDLEACFLDRRDYDQGYFSKVLGMAVLKSERATVDLSCLESSSKLMNRVFLMEQSSIKEPFEAILYCTEESSYEDHARDTARTVRRMEDLLVRVCSTGLNAVVVIMDSSAPFPDRDFSLNYGRELVRALREEVDVPVITALLWNSDTFDRDELARVVERVGSDSSVLLLDSAVLTLGLKGIESKFRALVEGVVVRLMPLLEGGEVPSKEGFDTSHFSSTMGCELGTDMPPTVAIVGYSRASFDNPHPCRSGNCSTYVLVKSAKRSLSYAGDFKVEDGAVLLLIRGAVDEIDLVKAQSYLKRVLGAKSIAGVADVRIEGARWIEVVLLVARIPIAGGVHG